MTIWYRSFFLIVAFFILGSLCLAEDGILVIHVTDADEKALAGIVLSNKGTGPPSDPTNSAGDTRLIVPKSTRPGDWVSLQVLKGTDGNENWILISPWDGRVAMPPVDNKPDRFVLVVVAQKFDKRLLANPVALRAMAERVNRELSAKIVKVTINEEQRQAALMEVAKSYGLGADEIDKAIQAWGEKTNDLYEDGLAALYERNYPVASELLSKSLEQRKAELEKKKAEVADAASFLGQSLYEQGRYEESANAYQKAVALRPDDSRLMNNLALSLYLAGRYAEAVPFLKQVLEIDEKNLGPNHPDVATSLNNLATLYFAQGKYEEAELLFKQSLLIIKKTLEPSHLNVAQSLNNLAVLYRDQGKYAQAEPLFKQSLEIREGMLGPNHPYIAQSFNNLAVLYRALHKYAQAELLFKRALDIYEKVLGLNHPYVALVLENYAILLRKTNRETEAAALEKRAKAIRDRNTSKNPKN